MNDQEKSVMLAKAMGWKVTALPVGHDDLFIIVPNEYDRNIRSFYSPANMALAWRVLNWAETQKHYYPAPYSGLMVDVLYRSFWTDETFFELPPADAQRLWLDKILELAIEAGLVETTIGAE